MPRVLIITAPHSLPMTSLVRTRTESAWNLGDGAEFVWVQATRPAAPTPPSLPAIDVKGPRAPVLPNMPGLVFSGVGESSMPEWWWKAFGLAVGVNIAILISNVQPYLKDMELVKHPMQWHEAESTQGRFGSLSPPG